MKQLRFVFLAVVFSAFNIVSQQLPSIPVMSRQVSQFKLHTEHSQFTDIAKLISDQVYRHSFRGERVPEKSTSFIIYLPLEVTVNLKSGTNEKYFFIYNSAGHPTGELYQTYQNNAWVNHTQYTFTNNSAGYRLTSFQQQWLNNAWLNHYYDTYIYDSQNHLTELTSQTWINSAWVNQNKMTTVWSTSGNPLIMTYYNWLNNAWEYQMRFTYTYNSYGKPLTMLMENWINNQWAPLHRSLYSYTANGHPMMLQVEHYENSMWIPDHRSQYTCNGSGCIITELQESYDGSVWLSDALYSNTYNAAGYQTVQVMQLWSNNTWENSSKITWGRTQWGSVVSFLLQGSDGNVWYDQEKSDYTFDVHGNGLTGAGFKWQANAWVESDMFLEMSYNGSVGDGGYYGYTYSAVYQSFTDISDLSPAPENFKLYQNFPNPFNPLTVLRYELPVAGNITMTVYNSLGKKVKEILNAEMPAGNYEMVFDGENLSSGAYFLRMDAAGFSKTIKLLLVK